VAATRVLRLVHEGRAAILRVEEDRGQRALARAGGWALSYSGELPRALREVVLAVGARFGALREMGDATARLREIAEAVAPGARLEVADGGMRRLPRWPSTLRTGIAPLEGGEIWPFDAELAGLELDARRLIKRECFDAASAARDRAWLESHALPVREVAPGVLFAARDARSLGDEIDRAEEGVARGDADAAAWLGRALGYPECCIERFTSIAARDDASLVARLLPPVARSPASPLSQWLNQPLTIVSHVPCALDCAATLALGASLLERLDARTPGWAAAWERLARRIQIVDEEGRCLALDAEGDVVRSAIELRLPRGPEPKGIAHDVPELAGARVSSLRAFAIADHRAPLHVAGARTRDG
jgi:hypothetical protein